MGYQRFSKILTFVVALLLFADCSKAPEKQEAGPLPVNVVTVVEKEVHEFRRAKEMDDAPHPCRGRGG